PAVEGVALGEQDDVVSRVALVQVNASERQLIENLVGDARIVDVEKVDVLELTFAKLLAHRIARGRVRGNVLDQHFVHGARERRIELDRAQNRSRECVRDASRGTEWT